MNCKFILLSILISLVFGCKPNLPEDEQNLYELEQSLEENPSRENVNKYLSELAKFISDHKDEEERMKAYLYKGVEAGERHNQISRSAGFLQALIRNYYQDELTADHITKLAAIMERLRKPHVSAVLYQGLVSSFPQHQDAATATQKYQEIFKNVDTFMVKSFNQVFEDPDRFGVNQRAALKYVDVTEAYALVNPNHKSTPGKLYQASEIARSIRTFQKALNLYDWILEKYPDYEKSATVLFLKGFVLENELEQLDLAQEVYEEFLQKYPEHDLAPSVKFLLENIGKPDDEILEFIEQQKKQNQESTEADS